jgi:uncharacterized protein (TIGR02679 family)
MADQPIPEALRAWARLPGPAKILAQARQRIEERGTVAGTLDTALTADERQQVGRLLGLRWAASEQKVTVAALERALGERGSNLRSMAEGDKPLRDRRAERAQARAARDEELENARAALTEAGVAAHVAAWLTALRRPKTTAEPLTALMRQTARAFVRLPGPDQEPVSLAAFAAQVAGDPHALDKDRELGRIVALLAEAITLDAAEPGCDLASRISATAATSSERWRAAWESHNVLCDQVSSLVLTLNLRLTGTAPAAALTTAAAAAGEPVWLTLRSLKGQWLPDPSAEQAVYVCENPAIVEAAAEQYPPCAALICTFGWPSAAAIWLIEGLHHAGTRLLVRADDDPAGQRIVAKVLQHAPTADLWRYRQRSAAEADETREYEEQVLGELLDDLRRPHAA